MELYALVKSNANTTASGRASVAAASVFCTFSHPPATPTANWCGPTALAMSSFNAKHAPRAANRRSTLPHATGRTPPARFGKATTVALRCAATAAAGASPASKRVSTHPAASNPVGWYSSDAQCSNRALAGPVPECRGCAKIAFMTPSSSASRVAPDSVGGAWPAASAGSTRTT